MDVLQALQVAQDHLQGQKRDAFRHAQVCYFASLGIYANGGTPPDAPDADDYFD